MAATVWRGHLSFGLISIPVRLHRAARPERVRMHQLYRRSAPDAEPPEPPPSLPARGSKIVPLAPRKAEPAGPAAEPARPSAPEPVLERVRQAVVPRSEDNPVALSALTRGYEAAPDQWVVIEKEELKQIAPKTSTVIDVAEFVHFSEIDPIYLETSYYVVPDKNGEKAYSILYQALRETGYAAVGHIAMHNREHVLAIRPGKRGLVAHTLYHADEVHGEEEHPANADLTGAKELDLARKFVDALAGQFEPEKYKDAYRERLRALIGAKLQGRQIAETARPAAAGAEVVDMMEALKKSLELARKPVAAEQAQPPRKRRGKTGG